MKKWMPVLVQAGLLTTALGLAYWSWTSEAPTAPTLEAQIWELAEDAIRTVRLEDRSRTVVLTVGPREQGEAAIWLEVRSRPAPAPDAPGAGSGQAAPDAGLGKEPPPAPAQAPTGPELIAEFRGGPRAQELLQNLTRLRAKRDLGQPAAETLQELGLDASQERVVVTTGQGERSLQLGGEVFGSGQRYVLETESRRVFVIEPRLVLDLAQAEQRLLDRRLHLFSTEEPDRIELVAGERTRVLVREPKKKSWAAADAPDRPDEQATTWIGKLERLNVGAYGTAAPTQQLVLEARHLKGSEALGFMKLFRDATGAKTRFYAETEHTAGRRVEITRYLADELLMDLDSFMAGKPVAAPPAARNEERGMRGEQE